MNQVRRRGPVPFEDVLRELEAVEHQLLTENGALAMQLMVIDAKIRDRFLDMERQVHAGSDWIDDFLYEEPSTEQIRALIPRDLPAFPTLADVTRTRERKRTLETVGAAAALALVTAIGVFGVATLLQSLLSWFF